MTYGLPYKGSKSRIADKIVALLPKADTLYDVFAGGCAITHAALLTNKYNHIVMNDITDVPQLFLDAAHGLYHDFRQWVSRSEFEMFKDADPFIRVIYSFGNDCSTYMYGKDIEPYKKAAHKLICADTVRERRIAFKEFVRQLSKISDSEQAMKLEHLERLERLQRFPMLQSLESFGRLEMLQQDYRTLTFKENSIIYCDPPYKDTRKYAAVGNFDSEAFYEWCRQQTQPIFISEYSMPDDFECIAQFKVTKQMSAKGGGHAIEKLFTLKH